MTTLAWIDTETTIDGRMHECGCRLEECVERRAAS